MWYSLQLYTNCIDVQNTNLNFLAQVQYIKTYVFRVYRAFIIFVL